MYILCVLTTRYTVYIESVAAAARVWRVPFKQLKQEIGRTGTRNEYY